MQSIADASGSNTGLVNLTTTYSWDGNGNLYSNTNTTNTTQNKAFTYNLLNLPLVATFAAGTATYTYDATGNKLRKVDLKSGTTTTTDYISGIEYDNSTTTIGFIQTEEGKAVPNGTGYDYEYYLGDNLGNTRVTFGTKTGAAVLYQQDDYYPFGLEINRSVLSPKNEYLYNKKELQEEFTEYDYGARFYDPVIARWNTIDPMSEINRRWSPYNYVKNNPIRLIDPDGMTAKFDSLGNEYLDGNDAKNYALGIQAYDKKQVASEEPDDQATQWPTVANVISNKDFVPHRNKPDGTKLSSLKLANEQLAKAGYVSEEGDANAIHTYSDDGVVNSKNTATAVNYINVQLQKGIPVVIGVDVFSGRRKVNFDGTTDHFVVIVGSGTDEKGEFYRFYDNSTANFWDGTSNNNKLYYNKSTGMISGNTDSGYGSLPNSHPYIMSQVRKSISQKP